jgi:hypothetical protein
MFKKTIFWQKKVRQMALLQSSWFFKLQTVPKFNNCLLWPIANIITKYKVKLHREQVEGLKMHITTILHRFLLLLNGRS